MTEEVGPVGIELIPIFDDNYVYVFADSLGEAIVVDPGDGPAVEHWLDSRGWRASAIWITHHHPDHIGGVEYLRKRFGAKVYGHRRDAYRLPALDFSLTEGDSFSLPNGDIVKVWSVDGHTRGHLAYWIESREWLFSGDVLFSLGCGRLFEGTQEEMWSSLSKIIKLSDQVWICCTHEYTAENGEFASLVEPGNSALQKRLREVKALREEGIPTVPMRLGQEKATNPFLRPTSSEVLQYLKMDPGGDPAEVFGRLRKTKDNWDRSR